jgi:hypothetical protein
MFIYNLVINDEQEVFKGVFKRASVWCELVNEFRYVAWEFIF